MSKGQGAFGDDAPLNIRDFRLVERAVRERWPISAEQRGVVVERLAAILKDPSRSAREVIQVARVLAAMSQANLATARAVAAVNEYENAQRRETPPAENALQRAGVARAPEPAQSVRRPIECQEASAALGLEDVTRLEIVAEDATFEAPAIERRDRTTVRFRMGSSADIWVSSRALYALLPPGPERELIFETRIKIYRAAASNKHL